MKHSDNNDIIIIFDIVKLGLKGYILFFLLFLFKTDCGDSLKSPRRGGSNEYPQSMF